MTHLRVLTAVQIRGAVHHEVTGFDVLVGGTGRVRRKALRRHGRAGVAVREGRHRRGRGGRGGRGGIGGRSTATRHVGGGPSRIIAAPHCAFGNTGASLCVGMLERDVRHSCLKMLEITHDVCLSLWFETQNISLAEGSSFDFTLSGYYGRDQVVL